MSFDVSSATNVTTNKADPKGFTCSTFRAATFGCYFGRLKIAADRAPKNQKFYYITKPNLSLIK